MDKMPEVDIEEEEETPATPTEMHEFKMLPLFMDFEDFVRSPLSLCPIHLSLSYPSIPDHL